MNKRWLRQQQRGHPPQLQRVLGSEHLRDNANVLNTCLRQNPKSVAVLSRLANCLADRGRKPEALRAWRALVRLLPGQPSPYFQRAHWAMRARAFREAEKFLRLCTRRDTGYFRETSEFWRAEALYRLGHFCAARKALASVPDDYYEMWFLDYKRWSKAELAAKLAEALRDDA